MRLNKLTSRREDIRSMCLRIDGNPGINLGNMRAYPALFVARYYRFSEEFNVTLHMCTTMAIPFAFDALQQSAKSGFTDMSYQ